MTKILGVVVSKFNNALGLTGQVLAKLGVLLQYSLDNGA